MVKIDYKHQNSVRLLESRYSSGEFGFTGSDGFRRISQHLELADLAESLYLRNNSRGACYLCELKTGNVAEFTSKENTKCLAL